MGMYNQHEQSCNLIENGDEDFVCQANNLTEELALNCGDDTEILDVLIRFGFVILLFIFIASLKLLIQALIDDALVRPPRSQRNRKRSSQNDHPEEKPTSSSVPEEHATQVENVGESMKNQSGEQHASFGEIESWNWWTRRNPETGEMETIYGVHLPTLENRQHVDHGDEVYRIPNSNSDPMAFTLNAGIRGQRRDQSLD